MLRTNASADYQNLKVVCAEMESGETRTITVDNHFNSIRYIAFIAKKSVPKRKFVTQKLSDNEIKVWRLE